MSRLCLAAALAGALLLVSCATPYGHNVLIGGYSDQQVDATHYRVKFDGNGYASEERIWNFWMYRCAQLTLEKGYTHFDLHKPGEPLAQAGPLRNVVYREGDEPPQMLRTKGGGGGGFVYIPGQTIRTWHSDAVVGLYRQPLPEGVMLLNAKSVLDALGPYVKSDGKTTPPQRDELFKLAVTKGQAARRGPNAVTDEDLKGLTGQ